MFIFVIFNLKVLNQISCPPWSQCTVGVSNTSDKKQLDVMMVVVEMRLKVCVGLLAGCEGMGATFRGLNSASWAWRSDDISLILTFQSQSDLPSLWAAAPHYPRYLTIYKYPISSVLWHPDWAMNGDQWPHSAWDSSILTSILDEYILNIPFCLLHIEEPSSMAGLVCKDPPNY